MTLEEAVRADMSKAIHDQLADIVNKAVRKGYDLAKAELIHCKDCKYCDGGIDEDGKPFLKCLSGRSYGGTNADDFCSWAERKDNG